MRQGTLRRHRTIGVAALLSLSGIVIAACAPATEEAAPVYMMGTVAPDMFGKVSPVVRQSVVAAPSESSTVSDPVALAPSLTASAAAGKGGVDVIPLDEPPSVPAKPAPKAALLAANPAPMSARFMPPPDPPAAMPESVPITSATPKADPSPIAAASTRPLATAPVMPPPPEPRAAEMARAEPAPLPVPAPQPMPAMTQPVPPVAPPAVAAEPAHGDIATTGLVVNARDERSGRSRPRYYYAP